MLFQLLSLALMGAALGYRSEFVPVPGLREQVKTVVHPASAVAALPASFSWGDVNGTCYLTKSLNQHIPQYCGSCWAHGALSSFADRIKIARKAKGIDANLAIQYILNCGNAGSCHGGDHLATYAFIKQSGFVPFDTCLPYEACSSESTEGDCRASNYQCSAINTCRTCSTFTSNGGKCVAVDKFPNASIADYGSVRGADQMKAEIYARGPIACGVNAQPLHTYSGGVYTDAQASHAIDHIVSVVGWGSDYKGSQYWIVRNSWGEYWGEMGFFRVALGNNILGLESDCAWATLKHATEVNFPCFEDGSNCQNR
eukprot:NODE_2398_length_1210_cov_64.544358_g2187_i0.p2 GENE.NODE_2398_length_1210_cov_64.544358_g2187_i0~~NODE_2398_length_1210_cov_64.544358_g2187_i0.p2  ORF type:complete len:313 (-),score=51.42 NODE_2398_length_1210_cov_64.544358_g2187_i0:204-1142(-)